MPQAVNLRGHLAALPSFIRRLYWVYFTFIGLTLLSFGVITFIHAPAMAAGEPLARALCVFLAAFWTLRLIVAAFVFDVRPYLTHWFYRLGYHATTLVFIYHLSDGDLRLGRFQVRNTIQLPVMCGAIDRRRL